MFIIQVICLSQVCFQVVELIGRIVGFGPWERLSFSDHFLVSTITLVLWLPGALQLLVDRTAEQLMARAAATPLLIGASGSFVANLMGMPQSPDAVL